MKKAHYVSIILFILLLVSPVSAKLCKSSLHHHRKFSSFFNDTTVYPVFNSDRSYWNDYLNDEKPIVLVSGDTLGLTNPSTKITFFSFKFEIIGDDLSIDLTPSYLSPKNIFFYHYMYENNLILEGLHYGTGSPVDGLQMNGSGTVNIYERHFLPTYKYSYLGTFKVNHKIMEPASIVLLGSGFFVLFCHPKKNKV